MRSSAWIVWLVDAYDLVITVSLKAPQYINYSLLIGGEQYSQWEILVGLLTREKLAIKNGLEFHYTGEKSSLT